MNGSSLTKREKIWDVLFPTVFILLCEAAAVVLVFLLIGLKTGLYDPEEMIDQVHSLPLLVSCVFYVGAVALQFRTFRIDEMRFGLNRNDWPAWKWAVACVTATAGGHLWSSILLKSGLTAIFTGYTTTGAAAFEGQKFVLLFLATVLLGPAAEEIFFRGMTFRRAQNYWGSGKAAVLSALLFGLYHMNMIQLLYAFVMGLFLAFIYRKSGDLRLSIAAHMCMNAWACLQEPVFGKLSLGAKAGLVLAIAEAFLAAGGICLLIVNKSTKSSNN